MRKYIDLTHTIQEGMITAPAPWHPPVEISQLGRHCLEGRESYKLVLGSHTGTHMDTPAHMVANGSPRIDEIPLVRTHFDFLHKGFYQLNVKFKVVQMFFQMRSHIQVFFSFGRTSGQL